MKQIYFLIFIVIPVTIKAQLSLSAVELAVKMKHPVSNIDLQTLKETLADSVTSNWLLFDTRLRDEYEMSHLKDAIHIDPDMSSDEFLTAYGGIIKGKHLVFYCSVGYRSSAFIERVADKSTLAGGLSLLNLTGGIFRWYNNQNIVFNSEGITNDIHPYNKYWGTLLHKRKQ